MTRPTYPAEICDDCGVQLGRRAPDFATWSMGECGWCGARVPTTEPRDFGFPPPPGLAVTRTKAAE
jgi:hypothetical protein